MDAWRGLAKGVPLDRTLRVTLHFHPDLPFTGGSTLEAIADRGAYLSQFETRTGNGGLTAHPGADTWKWESRIFGGAYDEYEPAERPKYGSLNYRADPYGGSARFGSAYFLLAEHTPARTTFCFPDSVFEPDLFGTAEAMNLMEAAATVDFDDPLDDYIEAHVHGPIDIASDVEALVLDPSYRDTPFDEIARSLACPVFMARRVHSGRRGDCAPSRLPGAAHRRPGPRHRTRRRAHPSHPRPGTGCILRPAGPEKGVALHRPIRNPSIAIGTLENDGRFDSAGRLVPDRR
ncbi:DUF3626 domain-containing protein [Rhodococcus jostii]|uniref:DUF3626 domain-containing protein n=1 Tax=Rhodococcus jostii TaxID=132919 RepID=A0ABU4CTI8_RHOJO|nr:DUF3626 domain-containing protein [Rhodococcus jostii]MDV6286894.1 DUF3626 domain-containing protein [Rhodococcus jostii]